MVLLFLDDAYITHISKDKWKLNTIIKNHPITYVTFLFSFEIQYILVNFEERMFYLLPGIKNCQWWVKIREKKRWGKIWLLWKNGGNKQIAHKCPETCRFLGAMTTMTITLLMNLIWITDKQFFHRADFISCIFYSTSLYHTFTITNM